MDSVEEHHTRRTVLVCLGVAALCLMLNLIVPAILTPRHTVQPGEVHTVSFDGPAPLTVETRTTKGPKKDTVTLEAQISRDNAPLMSDSYTINASSTFPVDDRAGLSYLFPYRPERQTYPYTDPFAPSTFHTPARLDYLGPGKIGDLYTYQFHADVTDPDTGYHADHTIELQERTGDVLDETWDISSGDYQGTYRMSEESRDQAFEKASREIHLLRGLRVFSWFAGMISVVALILAAVAIARR